MSMDVADWAGSLLLVLLGGFGAGIGFRYWTNERSRERVVDRTLSEFDRSEAPQMYWMQAIGYLALTAAGLGICAIGVIRLFAGR